MDNKNKLDDLLRNRHFDGPQEDLADRIVMAARHIPQKQTIKASLFEVLSSMFVIPQPAVAMAVCLVLGIYFGFEAELLGTLAQDDLLSGFLDIDEVWL